MTQSIWIKLKSIEEVNSFVEDLMTLEGHFQLVSGKTLVNPKSIMSIFSLDLAEVLELRFSDVHQSIECLNRYQTEVLVK